VIESNAVIVNFNQHKWAVIYCNWYYFETVRIRKSFDGGASRLTEMNNRQKKAAIKSGFEDASYA